MISYNKRDMPHLNDLTDEEVRSIKQNAEARSWFKRIMGEADRVPQTSHTRDALENIAYDCASLDDAQRLAREALRKS